MANDDKTLRNRVVKIMDLVSKEGGLEGYTFLNCQINGPAVLAFLDAVRFQHNSFDTPDWDAVLWEVLPSRPRVIGAIGVTNCNFDGCRLTHIGIAGPPELLRQFRSG